MTPPRIAREYRRLSNKKRGTSLERQGSDNGKSARDNGWELAGDPYIDDGLSASRYARQRRDDFEQLVADLRTGTTGLSSRFGADVLILWESSRGSRKVGEWVEFIELCEAKEVLIWVTTHERLYDPRNGRDRKSLLEDAVDSEYESYKTHRRTSGTVAFQAQSGRPHGAPPDGLKPVYDVKTGDLLDWVEDTDRSGPYRELFHLLERGFSLSQIEARFREAGYLNLSGRPFRREHLRCSALRHAYAGLRRHGDQVYEGTWEGFIKPEQFWTVHRILSAPERQTNRNGRAVHELTGSLWCGVCGAPILKVKKGTNYQCQNCWRLYVQKAPLDELIIGSETTGSDGTVTRVLGVLLEYLARDDVYELLAQPPGESEELREIQADLARARAERDDFRAAKASNVAQALIFANSLEEKEKEVQDLERRERELSVPPSILRLIQPGADIWAAWQEAPLSARREIAHTVLTERYVGKVYVHPAARRGSVQTVHDRLEFRTGPAAQVARED